MKVKTTRFFFLLKAKKSDELKRVTAAVAKRANDFI